MAPIIDSRQWLKRRLEHLRAVLEADPSDDERKAIEAEIEQLEAERSAGRGRFLRWLTWGGRLPS